MKRKATLIGIISAGIVSAQLAMPVMAHAATANAAKIEIRTYDHFGLGRISGLSGTCGGA
ncbi:hypothetical protein [Alicyclobacillus fodiniaquatilis]|uniref:Uncharacterized protein n=1 Tax=Alicyclobacillus fodiniaquatilis TaxID=1661150 RepID=A0ABW4JJC7_9BACL